MQQGWISIHRSLTDHWLHQDKPFCRFGAWVDLLLMANHETKKFPAKTKLVTIERGQLFTSFRSLSDRWGWSKNKVERFLSQLEDDEMIIKKRDADGTLLTIVKYGFYQDTADTNGTQTGRRRDADGTRTGRNNNDNNENNENKKNIYVDQINEIFDYLNLKTGKKYTGRSKAHREHIIARLKEGYTVEEFKRVIDNKVSAWGHSEKMAQYLRPETLFSTKFETYLNDTETERQKARREDYELHEKQVEAIRAAAGIDYDD